MGTYNGFIGKLSRKVEARLADIEAVFNFGLGDEFEVAICALLEDILPARFGLCRGFVVAEDGTTAGDDLIIYDKMSAPTLRSNIGRQFSIREQIPIEAVYGYIECKHSIKDADVLTKAMHQAAAVKELVLRREELANPDYEENGQISKGTVWNLPRAYPPLKNQPFCAIFARSYDPKIEIPKQSDAFVPDLMILGKNHIATQSVLLGPDGIAGALFFDPKCGYDLRVEDANGNAYGLGLVTLLQALSWIELLPMDWTRTLNSAFAYTTLGLDL